MRLAKMDGPFRLELLKAGGFSLVELVVVVLLVSVLAAVSIPRFFGQQQFQEWGFSEDLITALRYAHKIAIASGCDTQVTTDPTGYQLNQRASCSSGGFTQIVSLPGHSGSGYTGTPPGDITLSVDALYFDPLGRPRNPADDLLFTTATQIDVGGRSILVEPETGFVHPL
ncbi:MAG: prepilin-type N-terminal cleavage/methylation domain-containing protein [Gammaproteobacteria bacterium]|nr:prepilin-type N-terminal cleavage/methylation domain-containing protein [Gammaproteobacteria bacterium]